MMKKQLTTITKRMLLVMALLLMVMACDEDESIITSDDAPPTEEEATDGEGDNEEENEDEEENDEDTEGIDPNLLTQSLKFRNMQVKQGTMPVNTNSPYYQTPGFQISQDTIFWVEGVINRLLIRKPDGFNRFIGTFMAQVPGSDSYIEGEFEREKENDSIVFWNFDFDPPPDWDLDLPLNFDLDVTLVDDETGDPIGPFPVPIGIEPPNSGNCGALYNTGWTWIETSVNGQYQSGPHDTFIQELQVGGCCGGNPPISYTGGGCNENNPDWTVMDYINSYYIYYDVLYFFEALNEVQGAMEEVAYNLDAPNVNFCTLNAPLRDDTKFNGYTGEIYDFDTSSCSFKIDNLVGRNEQVVLDDGTVTEFPLPIYAGSGDFVEYQLISKHFLKETRSQEGLIERIYINTGDGGTETPSFWYEITYKQDSSDI